MVRIAIFVLLLIFILVAVNFPKFRRTLGVTLVVLMGVIGFIIWQDTQERELEFERISVGQVQLEGMEVHPGLNSRSFVVAGRIHNLSENYTILSIELQATVQDCKGETCEIVGQEQAVLPLEVPGVQSRDFSVTMPFSVTPEFKGEAKWDYKVLKIRAR